MMKDCGDDLGVVVGIYVRATLPRSAPAASFVAQRVCEDISIITIPSIGGILLGSAHRATLANCM